MYTTQYRVLLTLKNDNFKDVCRICVGTCLNFNKHIIYKKLCFNFISTLNRIKSEAQYLFIIPKELKNYEFM